MHPRPAPVETRHVGKPETEDRWVGRPVLAAVLRALVLGVPLLVSSVAVAEVGKTDLLADHRWLRLTALLTIAFCLAAAVERLTRRLLPLAALLKLTMLFPDRAPSRFRVARRAGSKQQDEYLWHGATATPTSVAESVLSLIAQLGSHDRKTRGHSERVRVFTDMVADEMKLPTADRDRLRWAALLHDLGKLQVPARVLNKPSKLDDGEFAVIKRHPAWGAELAEPLLPFLGEWGRGILDHHERFDGRGYPNGIAGLDISLAGRIVGVVDAFETMTAARAYKKAMATKAARRELAACAGSQFDPTVVRSFLAISLPKLMWAMGPVSFAVQAPFLRSIAEAGARGGALTTQTAVTAAGAAVLATSGVMAVPGMHVIRPTTVAERVGAAPTPATTQEPRLDLPTPRQTSQPPAAPESAPVHVVGARPVPPADTSAPDVPAGAVTTPETTPASTDGQSPSPQPSPAYVPDGQVAIVVPPPVDPTVEPSTTPSPSPSPTSDPGASIEPSPSPAPGPTPVPTPDPVVTPVPDPTPSPTPDPVISASPDPVPVSPSPDPVPVSPSPDPVPVSPSPDPVPVSPSPDPVPVSPSPDPVPVVSNSPSPAPTPLAGHTLVSSATAGVDTVTITFMPGTYSCTLTPNIGTYGSSFPCSGEMTFGPLTPRQRYTLHISGGSGTDNLQWTITPGSDATFHAMMSIRSAVTSARDAFLSGAHSAYGHLPEVVRRMLELAAGLALGLLRRLFG